MIDTNEMAPYQVHSRREIISLLRALQESKQLVSVNPGPDSDPTLTSILDIQEESDLLVIDCAPGDAANHRLLASDNISFETALENIRMFFFSSGVEECMYQDGRALCTTLPTSVIRLQRREHYRVPTPLVNPLRCTIRIPDDTGGAATIIVPLQNVSGGGIAIVDEKRQLDNTIGRVYKDCRIDLPGGTLVVATLQIRNSYETQLPNGRFVRRVGCLFQDLPKPMLAAVQRYITKLEREQNARVTGMGIGRR